LTSGEWNSDDDRKLVEQALVVFAELGDESGLARSWSFLGELEMMVCQYDAGAAAHSRAVEHARRAGDKSEELRFASSELTASFLGRSPVRDLIPRFEAFLKRVEGTRHEPAALFRLAALRAMEGDRTEARRLYEFGKEKASGLGQTLVLAWATIWTEEVGLLLGDPTWAEAELREGNASYLSMGEQGVRSTLLTILADSLYMQGRYREAAEALTESERVTREEDVASAARTLAIRGKLLALQKEREVALDSARRAVELGNTTDDLYMRATLLLYLAETLVNLERRAEAVPVLEEAAALARRKGARMMEQTALSRLRELEPVVQRAASPLATEPE
jgi:hypothetical protein